uniref:Nucleic-acid-binding protein n=1 Tax=Sipha flava TaxID=143950 RepID=A0A2S2Q869_9HEMI
MDPNSKASIPNNDNPAQLNKQNRQKVPPLVIKKNRLLSNQDDSNSPSPNSDDEFRSPRKTAWARDLSPANSSFFPTQNRFSPLEIENSNQVNPPTNLTNNIGPENNSQGTLAKPKIPPIYVHNISDYVKFHESLDNITIDDYSIINTKSALKLNLCSVDDYRATTNYLDESKIDYHTFQLPENKQLSIIIRNLPVNITEQCIFNELIEQKFEVKSVTRLQNKFKNPLPIVAVLLSKPSTGIYSLTLILCSSR